MDKVNIDIDSFDTLALKLGDVLVQGVRVSTGRTHEGLLRACGIELVTPAQTNASPAAATSATGAAPAYALSVASVRVSDCRFELNDQAVTPATTLAIQLDQFTIAAPESGGPLAIVGKLELPGIAKRIELSGTTSPFAQTRTAAVMLRVSGLDPTALKPYLNAIGLESQFTNGTFACDLNADLTPKPDGNFAANAHLSKLSLANTSQLLGLDDVSLQGVSADAHKIRFDSIAVSGPTLVIQRDASGAVSLLGFKTRPPVASPKEGAPAAQTSTPAAPPPLTTASATPAPRLEIGKFIWHGVHVHFDDEAVSPPQSIGIDDVGVELTDLKLGLDPRDYAANSGKIKAWLAAPRFVDRFDLSGNVAPGPKALLLDVTGAGTGISPSALAPYLSSLGLAPLTTNGTINFHAQLSVAHDRNTLSAGLSLDQIRYADPAQTLLAVDSLKIGNVALAGSDIGVTDATIEHPQARIERDHDGNLVVAGIKLVSSSPSPPLPAASPTISQPPSAPSQASTNPRPNAPATQTASSTPSPAAPAPLTAELDSLRIAHAQLWWIDHAVSPDVNASLTADVGLQHLTIGKAADPANLQIVAAIPGVIEKLDVVGKVSPAPGAQSASFNIAGDGIVIGPMASYLPPGITSTLKDGSLRLALDAKLLTAQKGALAANLIVNQLDYRDAGSPTSLFKLDNLTLAASRFDPKGGVIAFDEVSTHGIACDVTQLPGGKLQLLGFQIAPAPAAPQPAVKAKTTAEGAGMATPAVAPSAPASPTPAPDAAALVAAARKALPLITLEKLDLNVSRFALIDGSRPAAAPLALEDLTLRNTSRIECLGKDPESKPPTALQLVTRVAPLADRLAVDVKLSPFTRQPSATLDLAIAGIHGDGLTKYSPDLKKTIDGSGMTNGQFGAHVEATLKLDRHSPIDFDLSHPFGVEFDLTNVKYRSAPNGPVLAGIDEVRSEGVRVIPATGDVTIKTLELTNPNALLIRDTDGIHALGWVLKSQPPATQPSAAATAKPPQQPARVATLKTAAPASQPAAPRSEIKIDHIVASGMNVRIEDRTTKPITVLPLNGLDLEIRDLSSLALYQDKPFRFSALINAGKVNLPARTGGGSEDRDLFSQLTASGKIGLYPELNGWSKIAISGFDLSGATAEAAAQSVTLTKGAFDTDIDLHFEPGNVIAVQSKLIFTDMSLAEPPKGPISRFLVLPAPLDVVLGILEDPDGSITLPVNFSTKELQPQGIAGAAAGAVTSVIATAVASAPVKAVNAVATLFGVGAKKPGEEQLVTLGYAPGAIALEMPEQIKLALLAQRMIKEPALSLTIAHQFGSQDARTVAARANPSADEAKGLAYRLRARKLELSRLRSEVSGEAEAQLGTFDEASAAPTLLRLRAIDRDLAVTEIALDRTYDMLRPGADRQADRRTRAAALEIASQRLDAVRTMLRSAGVADVDARVKLIHPTFDPSKDSVGSVIAIQPVQTKG